MALQHFLVIGIVVAVVIGGLMVLAIRSNKVSGTSSTLSIDYTPAAILTDAELNFYRSLELACGDSILISLKTRLADIVNPSSTEKSEKNKLFWKTASKHIDFLLIDRQSFAILAAIELDDSSHQRKQRIERDDFVDSAFRSSGIPLLRFEAKRAYQPQVIKEVLDTALA